MSFLNFLFHSKVTNEEVAKQIFGAKKDPQWFYKRKINPEIGKLLYAQFPLSYFSFTLTTIT